MARTFARLIVGSLALALFVTPTPAKTWIVSTGPGGDFTNIQPAIDAAQPGDRILVYSTDVTTSNVVDKGVTIMGVATGAGTGHGFVITGLPANQVAAIVDLDNEYGIQVLGCKGTVLLSGVNLQSDLVITASDDVRAFQVDDWNEWDNTTRVSASRYELVDAIALGVKGIGDCFTPGSCWSSQAWPGLRADQQSRLHLVRSRFWGGHASSVNCPFTWTGDGSPGIEAVEGTEVLLAGNGLPQHEVRGGWGGQNCHYWNTCEYGGQGAPAVELDGELWHSGTALMGGTTYNSPNCGVSQAPSISKTSGSTVHRLVDADPTLTLIGAPAAGATVQFEVAAPAGADVLLYLGRKPVVISDPTVRVELLTPMHINWPLGIITGTAVQKTYKIRPLPTGYTFYAQAELTYPGGEVRRTNSLAVVVR
jgi:hypothetical protein